MPTHVVNEEKKLWKAAKDLVSCSMPLPEEVEGGEGDDLLHFSPVLPPLMAPPELREVPRYTYF